jgi:hypothetical protein
MPVLWGEWASRGLSKVQAVNREPAIRQGQTLGLVGKAAAENHWHAPDGVGGENGGRFVTGDASRLPIQPGLTPCATPDGFSNPGESAQFT